MITISKCRFCGKQIILISSEKNIPALIDYSSISEEEHNLIRKAKSFGISGNHIHHRDSCPALPGFKILKLESFIRF